MNDQGHAFVPGARWLDSDGVPINAHGGGILHHGDAWYWYGEHKVAGRIGNTAQVGVSCYVSQDLYTWRNAGTALAVSPDPGSEIAVGCILERPKVAYDLRRGRFVMWFHLELKDRGYSAARAGVAIADRPTGPFRYLGSCRPNAGDWPLDADPRLRGPLDAAEAAALAAMPFTGGAFAGYPATGTFRRDHAGGQMSRDMTLFTDDDGAVYQIRSSEENGTLHIARLRDDLLATDGAWVRLFPGGFNEAPALCKHRGLYYLISSGCTGWAPNPARAAVAEHIFGPWTELGNPCLGSAEQVATTFAAQSTFILPLPGTDDGFIFMADRWCPGDAIDGRYVWLPLRIEAGRPVIRWRERWDLAEIAGRAAVHPGV